MLKPTPRVNPSADQGASNLTLRTLFDAEESALLRYAFSLTGRRAVAEEIVQEVFLQLHARWKEIASPKAWLFRSVRNRAFNYLRDHQKEVLTGDGGPTPAPQDDNTPDTQLQRMETTAALRRLIEELDETDQQLIRLKYFEGLKYREISQQTGLSISNVGYRLHHILKGLAHKLRPLGIDDES